MADIPLPDGYEPLFRSSPFLEAVGPLFMKRGPNGLTIGLRIEERHTNMSGTAHGGLLSTLADLVLGLGAALTRDPPIHLATASLKTDFFGVVNVGQWLEGTADVQRVGSGMCFATCELLADGRRVCHASGIFRVLDRGSGSKD